MQAFRSTIARLAAALLPPTCCLCDAAGLRDLRGFPLDLCAICRELLPSARQPLTSGGDPPTSVFAPYLYRYPVHHLIRRLKFSGERSYGRLLGQLLAGAVADHGLPLPQAIVPMPLHPSRLRQRGFNQAHDIARYVGACLGLPLFANVLRREHPTREQSGLTLAERRVNVRGAFAVMREPPAGHLALVDDVFTTGSTAAEAARVLRRAGAQRVDVWAVARARRAAYAGR